MAESLDIDRMLLDLIKAGVVFDLELDEDGEERYNRIIHLFDIHIVQTNYADLQDIAKLVHGMRKSRGQRWINKL